MREAELVARAHRAAAQLETAWERWRTLHGLAETPAQPVVSYVGHALREPWGQPRVVIGISAEEADSLAEYLAASVCDVQPRPEPDSADGDPAGHAGPSLAAAPQQAVPVAAIASQGEQATTGDMTAELAGWVSGELPGQASERLASLVTGAPSAAPAERPTCVQ